MMPSLWTMIGFGTLVIVLLAIDLGVFHKKNHQPSAKEAGLWTLIWVMCALVFNIYIYLNRGIVPATEFLTGYVIELSLSVDNLFIFVLIFKTFHIKPIYQHRVLYWGIVGAFVMRAVIIFAGTALVAKFHWIFYIFGAFLIISGIKIFVTDDEDPKDFVPEKNILVRILKKFMPLSTSLHGEKFFVKENGQWHATTMFVVLLIIESMDLVFAMDSIPAIFAITKDPFIIYTSNICAILGLRSLYFLLAHIMDRIRYLKTGLSVILVFIGVKMLIAEFYKIPVHISLMVIMSVLTLSVAASLLIKKKGS